MSIWIMIPLFFACGILPGICLGAFIAYKLMKAEVYEYVKASRRDQEYIKELQQNIGGGHEKVTRVQEVDGLSASGF